MYSTIINYQKVKFSQILKNQINNPILPQSRWVQNEDIFP